MVEDKELVKILSNNFNRCDGNEFKTLTAIIKTLNGFGYCSISNKFFVKMLTPEGEKPITEKSVSNWLSALKEKKVINIVINSHKHQRRIYIKGFSKYVPPENIDEMSPEQRLFHEAFPNKIIDCDVPKGVNIKLLINEIKESDFLTQADNMTLKSYAVKYYDKIIKGNYRNALFSKPQKNHFSTERPAYTKEEYDALMTPIEEIEI